MSYPISTSATQHLLPYHNTAKSITHATVVSMFSGPQYLGMIYNLILCISGLVQVAGVTGRCQKETRCVRQLCSHTPATYPGLHTHTHTDFGCAKYEQPVSNAPELLQVWFDYRTVVEGQTGAGFNIHTSHSSWLPVEALPGLPAVCRNTCAALGVNGSGAVVLPSPHLHVELDLEKVVGIIKSISSIVSCSVIIIKRC